MATNFTDSNNLRKSVLRTQSVSSNYSPNLSESRYSNPKESSIHENSEDDIDHKIIKPINLGTPRPSILRNPDHPHSSAHGGTPRQSVLRIADVNDVHGDSPRPSVIRIDETANTNSLVPNGRQYSPRSSALSVAIREHRNSLSLYNIEREETPRPSVTTNRASIFSNMSRARQSVLRIGDIEGHNGNRPYNILTDFLIFCATIIEIVVVLVLAISHFLHMDGMLAIAMLLPLGLNCVGIIYYLSDKMERLELERTLRVTCLTDFLQVPILGPVFTALKVLTISCGCSSYTNYERIEAIAVKLRQAGGFFSAAPEALILLTVLLTMEQDENKALSAIQYLEIGSVLLFVFSLAESNCYGPLSDYYKMWKEKESGKWHLENTYLWQKLLLFLHAFTSIAAKLLASAAVKSSVYYYWKSHESTMDFPVALATVVFVEMGLRLVIHYVCRQLRSFVRDHEVSSSCYESINYAWRAAVLDYGFQSENVFIQLVFYVENLVCFGSWVYGVLHYNADSWIEELVLTPVAILFTSVIIMSFILLITCKCLNLLKIHGPCRRTKPMSEEMKSRIIHEFARSISVPEAN